jgi:hypothetical protein
MEGNQSFALILKAQQGSSIQMCSTRKHEYEAYYRNSKNGTHSKQELAQPAPISRPKQSESPRCNPSTIRLIPSPWGEG